LKESKRRKWALNTIDASPFQFWVVIVAGIGFLTDSFGLFALNVVTPMLGYVYWPHNTNKEGVPGQVPSSIKTAMMCSTLVGTMLGQIAFGFAADVLGRRKMYGLELVVIIVGTMLLLMSSNGEKNSMDVGGWLIAWRAVMGKLHVSHNHFIKHHELSLTDLARIGIGIGADYPLSAVITAEFAPRKHRARMLACVFFAQPVGQLLANVLSLAVVEAYGPQITDSQASCPSEDYECFRAIDRLWRLVIGIGIIPATLALAFRFTIPESPRYKLDVLQNVPSVFEDTKNYYGAPELEAEHGELDVLPVTSALGHVSSGPRPSSSSSDIAPLDVVDDESDLESRPSEVYARPAVASAPLPPGDPNFVPPLASWQDAKKFFISEGNWQYLLGTSLAWLFLDFAFYGLGLSSPQIVSSIWQHPNDAPQGVFSSLRDNSLHTLVMVSIGTIIGGLAMIKVIKYASPKVIQFWGFLALFVLFIVTGSAWTNLLDNSRSGLIVLYVLSHIAFNLGPNVTTFIVSCIQALCDQNPNADRSPLKSSRQGTDVRVMELQLLRVSLDRGSFKSFSPMPSRETT
jgi:PHS family inorganic phosphate transporter-like MFS transporter